MEVFILKNNQEMQKIEKCQHSFGIPVRKNGEVVAEYHCCHPSMNDMVIENDVCDKCDKYKSRYIEYPISVNKIETEDFAPDKNGLYKSYIGKPVVIRVCDKTDDKKTYLGVFVGEVPSYASVSYDKEQVLHIRPAYNPAIFVPELNRIVLGCESWWKIIDNKNDLSEISDEDINNVWYMKALKSML